MTHSPPRAPDDACIATACVLGIGPLTPTGRISAQTIHSVFGNRIITLCNHSFRNSLDPESVSQLGHLIDVHSWTQHESRPSSPVHSHDRHYEFGSPEFCHLTTLKWTLLRKLMESRPEHRLLLFTDLDVAWLDHPTAECSLLDSLDAPALIQDASTEAGTRHYCTGIMIWRNCQRSIDLLAHLEQRQLDMLSAGHNVNDETVFNLAVRDARDSHGILPLDPFRYVVGRRLAYLATARTAGLRWAPVAVHANFITTDRDKALVLRQFAGSRRLPFRMAYLMLILFIRGRVTALRRRFRRRA